MRRRWTCSVARSRSTSSRTSTTISGSPKGPFGEPDIVVEVRLLVERERATEQVHRLLIAPRHVGERAAQHQRLKIARLGGEHLRVKPRGVGELAGLMMAHGGLECFSGIHVPAPKRK